MHSRCILCSSYTDDCVSVIASTSCCVYFCLTDVKDTKYYLPEALAQVDICTSCKECCGYDPDVIPFQQSSGATCLANLILMLAAVVGYFAVL